MQRLTRSPEGLRGICPRCKRNVQMVMDIINESDSNSVENITTQIEGYCSTCFAPIATFIRDRPVAAYPAPDNQMTTGEKTAD